MKAGNLVRVGVTSTGDSPWVVKLYRERTPVLIVKAGDDDSLVWILDIDGKQKLLNKRCLDIVS